MLIKRSLAISSLLFALSLSLHAQFARTYGGTHEDVPRRIFETADGGFIVFCRSNSFSAEASWLVKLSGEGVVEWQKQYSLAGHSPLDSVCESPDGGYVLAGSAGLSLWLIKVDGLGETEWEKKLAHYGDGGSIFYSVCPAADAGYFVIATVVIDGNWNVWVIKISSIGGVIWQKSYDSGYSEFGYCAEPTPGGGCVIAGSTDGTNQTSQQLLVFEIDALGTVIWQKAYNAPGYHSYTVGSIRRADAGGFVLAGWLFDRSDQAMFAASIEETGALKWMMTLPGERLADIWPTQDGGFIAVGTTAEPRILLMKLDAAGGIAWQKAFGGAFAEAGWSVIQTGAGDYAVAGAAGSYGAGSWDLCVLRLSPDGRLGSCGFDRSSSLVAKAIEAGPADIVCSVQETIEAEEAVAFESSDTSGQSQSYQLCAARKLLNISISEMQLPATATIPPPGTGIYDAGASVSITAQSPIYLLGGSGYKFESWSGDATGTENPLEITLNDDLSVRAVYKQCAAVLPGFDGAGTSYDYCRGTNDGDGDNAGSGCFIATAAFRSPLHPAVRLLRDFRDRRLLTSPAGRSWVHVYYRVSPPIARLVGRYAWLRSAIRAALLPVIAVAFVILELGWVPALLLMAITASLLFGPVRRAILLGGLGPKRAVMDEFGRLCQRLPGKG